MLQATSSVLTLYPNFQEKIEFLFRFDENFRDLCADFDLCAKTLQSLSSELESNSNIVEEFWILKQSLQVEILNYVAKK